MSGSEDIKYSIYKENFIGAYSGNSAPDGIAITRIKQTASNQVVIAGSSSKIYFYPIKQPEGYSLDSHATSASHLSVRCTDMVMVNITTIWVSSNSPTIYSWHVGTKNMIKSKNTGTSNIESLESLSKKLFENFFNFWNKKHNFFFNCHFLI